MLSRAVTRSKRSRMSSRATPGSGTKTIAAASNDRQHRTGLLPVGHTCVADAAEDLLALQEENRQLKEGMLGRARIDQAMGVLVALGGVTPDEAWDVLREVSMSTNMKLRMVAEILVG